ncbi:MAG: hypothetical protein K9H61_04200 [Bacteroidia bacterium]|nr:hypothetical protein [Bacteroidia bacterium]MCF8426410.1 hypothetical protein [Bacteroidia bacterium]MCF8446178.1 hypothetical protein [Bacteroidia bacterium]
MGLDINIGADNFEELHAADYNDEKNDYFNRHGLSRTFCNFMFRQHVARNEPELDQIGRMTGVDITPLYDMEKYLDEDSAEHQLSFATNEKEREEVLNRIQADKDNLKGNIDIVLKTINALIQSLSKIDNLDQKLDDGGEDTLGYDFYFTDFNNDKEEGYSGNNFGQDLGNFKHFLEFAKERGTTTIWFIYG